MAAGFKCGSVLVPSGSEEITVNDLGLLFTPTAITVSMRQPSADADLISAYVTGALSANSFRAIFSSPTAVAGYYLDWVATSSGEGPAPTSDSLQVTYEDLQKEVGKFLGYNTGSLTASQISEIDGYIQSGIRQVYYPPMMEGVDANFEWSFIRQNGSVVTSAGQGEYLLPNGFGRIAGHLDYEDNQAQDTVPIIPYGEILALTNRQPNRRERPRFAATMVVNDFGTAGQKKKLYLFPKPDRAYTLKFVADFDTGKLDATGRCYPLGGAMFSELYIESCLAIAEQKANDEVGQHTAKYNQLLVGMIARDRKSGAQDFGRIGEPEGFTW